MPKEKEKALLQAMTASNSYQELSTQVTGVYLETRKLSMVLASSSLEALLGQVNLVAKSMKETGRTT